MTKSCIVDDVRVVPLSPERDCFHSMMLQECIVDDVRVVRLSPARDCYLLEEKDALLRLESWTGPLLKRRKWKR